MDQLGYLLNEPIGWTDTGDAKWMWRARHGSRDLAVYINDDWPNVPNYGIFVDGAWAYDIEEWPTAWTQSRKGGAEQ